MYKIDLEAQEIKMIIESLLDRPYRMVVGLLAKIDKQVMEQEANNGKKSEPVNKK